MVCEGVIALIWAAAGCALYEVSGGLNTGLQDVLDGVVGVDEDADGHAHRHDNQADAEDGVDLASPRSPASTWAA